MAHESCLNEWIDKWILTNHSFMLFRFWQNSLHITGVPCWPAQYYTWLMATKSLQLPQIKAKELFFSLLLSHPHREDVPKYLLHPLDNLLTIPSLLSIPLPRPRCDHREGSSSLLPFCLSPIHSVNATRMAHLKSRHNQDTAFSITFYGFSVIKWIQAKANSLVWGGKTHLPCTPIITIPP